MEASELEEPDKTAVGVGLEAEGGKEGTKEGLGEVFGL